MSNKEIHGPGAAARRAHRGQGPRARGRLLQRPPGLPHRRRRHRRAVQVGRRRLHRHEPGRRGGADPQPRRAHRRAARRARDGERAPHRQARRGGRAALPPATCRSRAADPDRLLLVAEALAMSVALAYDERRIAVAFDRIDEVAQTLQQRRLPPSPQGALLEQIGEALAHPAAARRPRRPRREARRAVGPSRARALLGAPRRRVRPAPARPRHRAQARRHPRHRRHASPT